MRSSFLRETRLPKQWWETEDPSRLPDNSDSAASPDVTYLWRLSTFPGVCSQDQSSPKRERNTPAHHQIHTYEGAPGEFWTG